MIENYNSGCICGIKIRIAQIYHIQWLFLNIFAIICDIVNFFTINNTNFFFLFSGKNTFYFSD